MTSAARVALALSMALTVAGQERKSLPNQAANSKVALAGTAITDRKEIQKLMGVDLGENYVVVKIRVTPQTPDPLRMSIDDFTLVSRKDGEKSGAMTPTAIGGAAQLIVSRAATRGGGIGTQAPSQIPIGTPGQQVPRTPGGVGNAGGVEEGVVSATAITGNRQAADPRLPALEAKVFRDSESRDPVEGLLYFYMEKSVKPKDLGLIYAGPAGRLIVDFK